jgi:hypothetical protein
VSANTGGVTFSIGQAIGTGASPTFAAVTAGDFVSSATGATLAFSTSNGDFQVDGQGNLSVAGPGSVININGAAGGLNVTADTSGVSIQTVGGVKAAGGFNVGTYGGWTTAVIDSSGDWVGPSTGLVTAAYAGTGVSVSANTGGVTFSIGQAIGTGASPTFAALTITTGASFAGGAATVGNLGTVSAPGYVINSSGGMLVGSTPGVSGSTCTQWTYGICTHL